MVQVRKSCLKTDSEAECAPFVRKEISIMSEIISPVIEELAERAMAFTGGREGYYPTPIEGLSFAVHSEAGGACTCSVYEPSFALMLQGRKRSECGESVYEYGAGDCMLVNVDVPARYTILEATPDKPFIGCSLKLDSVAVTEMIAKLPGVDDLEDRHARAIVVSRASAAMEADFLSLMRMFDSPEEMKLRAPILIRDIYSLLLLGKMGEEIRSMFTQTGRSGRVTQAVSWLRTNYRSAFTIEELAERVHMSVSSFHRHFKSVTSMSPLQYQKRLRLGEAQRLMLTEGKDVAAAAYAVGYESPTQFSREYKQLFGDAPGRDIKNRLQTVKGDPAFLSKA